MDQIRCRVSGCGHPAEAHEHYRRGSDCALCRCPGFAATRLAAWWRLALARERTPKHAKGEDPPGTENPWTPDVDRRTG